jgi:hypothetical protein
MVKSSVDFKLGQLYSETSEPHRGQHSTMGLAMQYYRQVKEKLKIYNNIYGKKSYSYWVYINNLP